MGILNGWKEIAKHLGRGVRTAQRWEHLGLPVHRPRGANRSAVTALVHEIDAWLAACPSGPDDLLALQADNERLRAENATLRRELAEGRVTLARLVAAKPNHAVTRQGEAATLQPQDKAI